MKKINSFLISGFIFILLFSPGCFKDPVPFTLKPRVVNLDGLNTPYNDYNISGPGYRPHGFYSFRNNVIFSTDSPSKGLNFDIVLGKIDLAFSEIGNGYEAEFSSQRIAPFLDSKCNSPSNEFGPIIFNKKNSSDTFYAYIETDPYVLHSSRVYLFASDRLDSTGDAVNDLNIFIYTESGGLKPFFGNTGFDDAYPAYDNKRKTLYFCSNRLDGIHFNIYKCLNDSTADIDEWLADTANASKIEPATEFNSSGNDKCPYAVPEGDYFVFSSDRAGGKGGFDLYYSKFNGAWTAPQNMGDLVNTCYDEYRPSLYYPNSTISSAQNKILIFSSNRPGGKGGYDLYLAVMPGDF